MVPTDDDLLTKLKVTRQQLDDLLNLSDITYYDLLKAFGRDVHKDLAIRLKVGAGVLSDHLSQLDSANKLWELATSEVGPGVDALKRVLLPKLHPIPLKKLVVQASGAGAASASGLDGALKPKSSPLLGRESVTPPVVARNEENSRPAPAVERPVVITVHGIKTRGKWQMDLAPVLANAGFIPVPLDYGNFLGLQLLLPSSRRKKVDWFRDEYRRVCAEEGVTRPSIVVHSFGTYLVARAMQIYDPLKFDRVIFCGSIVRREYPWTDRFERDQVRAVLNDFGRMDFWAGIVAWVVNDAGDSGRNGFNDTAGGKVEQIDHPEFRHGDYFFRGNYEESWTPFLLAKPQKVIPKTTAMPPNWRFRTIVIIAMLALALFSYFVALPRIRPLIFGDLNPPSVNALKPIPGRSIDSSLTISDNVTREVSEALLKSRKTGASGESQEAYLAFGWSSKAATPQGFALDDTFQGYLGLGIGDRAQPSATILVDRCGRKVQVPATRDRPRLVLLVFPFDDTAYNRITDRTKSLEEVIKIIK